MCGHVISHTSASLSRRRAPAMAVPPDKKRRKRGRDAATADTASVCASWSTDQYVVLEAALATANRRFSSDRVSPARTYTRLASSRKT